MRVYVSIISDLNQAVNRQQLYDVVMKEALGAASSIGRVGSVGIGAGMRMSGIGFSPGIGSISRSVEGLGGGIGISSVARSSFGMSSKPRMDGGMRVGISSIANPFKRGIAVERSMPSWSISKGLDKQVISNPLSQRSKLSGSEWGRVNMEARASRGPELGSVIKLPNRIGSNRFSLDVVSINNPFRKSSWVEKGRGSVVKRVEGIVKPVTSEPNLGTKVRIENRSVNLPKIESLNNPNRPNIVDTFSKIAQLVENGTQHMKGLDVQGVKTGLVEQAKPNKVKSVITETIKTELAKNRAEVKSQPRKVAERKVSLATTLARIMDRLSQVAPSADWLTKAESRVRSKTQLIEQVKAIQQEQVKPETKTESRTRTKTQVLPQKEEVEELMVEVVDAQEEGKMKEQTEEKIEEVKFVEDKAVTYARRVQILLAIRKAFRLAIYYGRNKVYGRDVVTHLPNQTIETTSAIRVKPNGEIERDGSYEAMLDSIAQKTAMQTEAEAQIELESVVRDHMPVTTGKDETRQATVDDVLKVVRPRGEEHNQIPLLTKIKRIFRKKVLQYQANQDISSQTEEVSEERYGT